MVKSSFGQCARYTSTVILSAQSMQHYMLKSKLHHSAPLETGKALEARKIGSIFLDGQTL